VIIAVLQLLSSSY